MPVQAQVHCDHHCDHCDHSLRIGHHGMIVRVMQILCQKFLFSLTWCYHDMDRAIKLLNNPHPFNF